MSSPKFMPMLVALLALTSVGLGIGLGLAYGEIRALRQEVADKEARIQQHEQTWKAVNEFLQKDLKAQNPMETAQKVVEQQDEPKEP